MDYKVYMPNEIFNDLSDIQHTHRPFAYAYYYFITYLYQFSKYGEHNYLQNEIKECVGYSKTNKTVDYIIKKNGTLDQLGYTMTTSDYPVKTIYDGFRYDFYMFSQFKSEMRGDIDDACLNSRNYKIKYPVKAFYRTEESMTDQVYDGTFYDISNTHLIKHDVFEKIIQSSGTNGLYIYGYLKYKCDKFNNSYVIAMCELSRILGFSDSTLMRVLIKLNKNNIIDIAKRRIDNMQQPNIYSVIR